MAIVLVFLILITTASKASSCCYKWPNEQQNPCFGLHCGPGEECVISETSSGLLTGRCECPQRCDDYGDSVVSSPVCASDGTDYESLCHLRLYACQTQQNVTMRFQGKCDPCKGFRCSTGTVCKLNAERRPECRCSEQCSMDSDPVCASDGNTYENECLMTVSACRDDINLFVVSKGHCTGENPCASKKCDIGEKCFVEQDGSALCRCIEKCHTIMKPVCAMDGKTYDNECEMKRIACLRKVQNAVRHSGLCGLGACAGFAGCRPPKICVLRDNQPRCECELCGSELDQVCASDGVTYSNPCKMRLEACQTGKIIFQKYKGICEGCANVQCEFYSYCVGDGKGTGKCRCPTECPQGEKEAVCATDGITYESECHMRIAACQQQKFIMVSFKGTCDSCSKVICSYGQKCEDGLCSCPASCPDVTPYQSICGIDGVLYPSECHLQRAACLNGSPIRSQPIEFCKPPQGIGECGCNRVGAYDDVCDTEGRCRCRPGVSGLKCDHCVPGFWGIHLIARGAVGCQPCGCSAFGSSRLDCEQSTGRCQCKNGASGEKCDTCDSDSILIAGGCVPKEEFKAPRDCSSLQCLHGAKCVMVTASEMPDCICPSHCAMDQFGMAANMTICGSDGNTYDNMCELTQFACTHQLDLVPASLGICANAQDGDELPMRRERKKERISGIGGKCEEDIECKVPDSVCSKSANDQIGKCACKPGMYFSNSTHQCVQDSEKEEEVCKPGEECCTDEACAPKDTRSKERLLPFFTGDGVLVFEKLRVDARKSLEVEIWLKGLAPDGLIFYWAKLDKNGVYSNGDFVALALIAYQPHFFWNLGSGVAYVKASSVLSNHRFYSIRFGRHLRNGSLQIDSGFTAHQTSLPKNEHLDVYGSDLYIGGVPDSKMLPSFIPELDVRFEGAVQQLSINGLLFGDIYKDFRHIEKVELYSGAPCLDGVCNKGFCFAKLNEFSCHCPPNITGLYCEKEITTAESDIGALFSGDKEHSYFNRITYPLKGQRSSNFSFSFKTVVTEGLIWWENQGSTLKNDYMGIFLREGRLGFAMNLGNDPRVKPVILNSRLNNNRWHRISVLRDKQRVEVRVDAESVLYFASEGSTELNSDGILWIGGKKHVPSGFPIRSLFMGCIKNVYIEGERLRLLRDVLSTDVPRPCPR